LGTGAALAGRPGRDYDAPRLQRPRTDVIDPEGGGPNVTTRRALGAGLALALLLAGPALAQRKNPDGLPVLLLSGGQREHHGYRDQAFYLANLLEDTGRYRVTICEDAAILETPAMSRYAILMVTADRRDPEFRLTEPQQRAILDYARAGHGYVSIHGGDCAAGDWLPEMKDLLGGVFSHFGQPDGKAITGTYTVRIADPDHPAAEGLDDFELKDELYSNMQMKDDVKPIATIAHQGRDWPVAWTYDALGPVFHTSLGHRSFGPDRDDPLRNPDLARLVLQGIDWVAARVKAGPPGSSGGRATESPQGSPGPGE
jgi:type 1 glutamine amidotransferase